MSDCFIPHKLTNKSLSKIYEHIDDISAKLADLEYSLSVNVTYIQKYIDKLNN